MSGLSVGRHAAIIEQQGSIKIQIALLAEMSTLLVNDLDAANIHKPKKITYAYGVRTNYQLY